MARKRMIDPSFWVDEKISELKPEAKLLFIGMWNFADDEGVLRLHSQYIRSVVFPYSEYTTEQMEEWIESLVKQNLIYPYSVNGQKYGVILNFLKHQVINKPIPSKLPKPSIQNSKFVLAIHERDNWTCHLCGKYIKDQHNGDYLPSLDHLITKSSGGGDMPHNLKTACLKCNKSRGNKPLPNDYGSSVVVISSQKNISEVKRSEIEEKRIELAATEVAGDQVNSLLNEFLAVNPTLNFGNKTQRKALESMVSKFGYEKTLRTIQFAISIQGARYAPTITTPHQLKEKMGELLVFYRKENGKKPAIINLDEA